MPIPAMPPLVPLDPPLQVVLVAPRIPPDTGNVARTCDVTGSRRHLVGPVGFDLSERSLRRAGPDDWRDVAPEVYHDWPATWPDRCVGLPMLPGQRSLDLAVAVGIAVYEAIRTLSR